MASRRRFLVTSSGLIVATPLAGAWASKSDSDPFQLGVASGCPRPNQVTLWTRLAPAPLQGGGMPDEDLTVRCRISRDSEMRTSIVDTLVNAPAEDAHSVHFIAKGLAPNTEYFYQFYVGEDASPIGRTRTAPAPGDERTIRLAVASCQHFEAGYYAAYADIARSLPDLVVHLGDYIYEYGPRPLGRGTHPLQPDVEINVVRQHASPEVVTQWDYRNRYAQYRLDPDLQAAHAAAPWVVSMDDHEIDNNWAGYHPEDPHRQTDLEFRVRRWAAMKAFYEHMPLEHPPRLNNLDASLQIYDQFQFGSQLNLMLLDTRQYRSDQPCGQAFPADDDCSDRHDPALTMLGQNQETWLKGALRNSDTQWNLLAQQTWFSEFRYPEERYNMDQWDGYTAQRGRLMDELANPQLSNPVILSGDWHCGAGFDVLKDFSQPDSEKVAAELAVTSISSPCLWSSAVAAAVPDNAHTKYYGGDQRGYLWCEISSENMIAENRVVVAPDRVDSVVVNHASLRVEAGKRGLDRL